LRQRHRLARHESRLRNHQTIIHEAVHCIQADFNPIQDSPEAEPLSVEAIDSAIDIEQEAPKVAAILSKAIEAKAANKLVPAIAKSWLGKVHEHL